MDTLDRTYEIACCELDELNKKGGNYDVKEIEIMGELVDIVKDIEGLWNSQESGYSMMGGNSYGNGYSRGRSNRMMYGYGRGSSYGRGYDKNGYSRGANKDEMLDHLQVVADMAMDEKDKKAIERLMTQMESN